MQDNHQKFLKHPESFRIRAVVAETAAPKVAGPRPPGRGEALPAPHPTHPRPLGGCLTVVSRVVSKKLFASQSSNLQLFKTSRIITIRQLVVENQHSKDGSGRSPDPLGRGSPPPPPPAADPRLRRAAPPP